MIHVQHGISNLKKKTKSNYILCTGGKSKVIQKGFIIILDSSKEKLH